VLRGADTYAHHLSLSEIKRSQMAVSASDQFSFASGRPPTVCFSRSTQS
jgi:hypothetical protein